MANQNNKNKINSNNKKKVSNSKNTNVKKNVKKEVKVKEEVKEIKPIVEEVKKVEVVKEEVKVVNETKKSSCKLTNAHKDLILVLLVVILFIVAVFVTVNKTPDIDIELPVAVEGTPGFTEITYSEYEAKMAEEKPFLVTIVQDGCGYCDMFKPVVEEVTNEYNFPAYYINLTNLTSEESDALAGSNSYLRRNNWGTPTTLFMYGDDVIDSIGGYMEKEEFVEFVKENIKVENNNEE